MLCTRRSKMSAERKESPHLWFKPPLITLRVNARAVRAELKRLAPQLFHKGFNWDQPVFRAPNGSVSVCLHSLGECAYDYKVLSHLNDDGEKYTFDGYCFRAGSIALLVTLAIQHPEAIKWPTNSAMTFESASGRIKYFICFEPEDDVNTMKIIRIRRRGSLDFGAGGVFIMQATRARHQG